MRIGRLQQGAGLFRNIPQADDLIHSGRGNLLTRRMKGDGGYTVQWFAERIEPLSRGHIPNLDGAVCGAGSQPFAVGAKRHGVNRVDVVLESSRLTLPM